MPQGNKWVVPIAIVVAGALIAVALFFSTGGTTPAASTTTETANVPEVTESDHILGNPDARIVLIEYSDFECPFCKNYHRVLHRIIDEYGPSGDVAWVYRHFPIVQLHSKAPQEAEAAECAAELGGNQAFWDYADRLFEVTPSNNGLDLAELPNIAEHIGLDRAAFTECIEGDEHEAKVTQQYNDAVAGGARGTPHTVVVIGGEQTALEGQQDYQTLRDIIESILSAPTADAVPAGTFTN